MRVPVEVRAREDGPGYPAVCPTIQGCHAEGKTIGETIDTVRVMGRTLLEITREDTTPIRDGDQA